MKYSFTSFEVRNDIIAWIQHYAKASGMKKVVIGISGGKDSAVCAALCCRAIGKENVIGLLLPNGTQSDIQDSIDICKALEIQYKTINIKPAFDAIYNSLDTVDLRLNRDAIINIAPRIRMTTLYAFAQSYGCRVCGTGNLSEATLGYFTKWGDGAHDFNPIAKLTSVEVVQVGLSMHEIPSKFVTKTPTDGLCGMSDEEKLGISYNDIHCWIRGINKVDISEDTLNKINSYLVRALHKLEPIPCFDLESV